MTQPVDGSGNWVYPVTALLTGEVLTATQSIGGVPSGASNAVTVLANIPAAPLITGTPYHTGDVSVAGTGVAGATLTLFKNGVSAGTTSVDGSGNWVKSMTPALAEGDALTASQTTAGGTSALSGSTTVLAVTGGGTPPSGNDGYLILEPGPTATDTFLLETADHILLEAGDKLLLEYLYDRLLVESVTGTGGNTLLETGDIVLLETGDKVLQEGASGTTITDLFLLENIGATSSGRGDRRRYGDSRGSRGWGG